MKYRWILLMASLAALLLTACGQLGATTSAPPDVNMAVRVEPEPPAVGESTLFVTLTDGSGSPVDGATLRVQGNMDHAGMTPVDREVSSSTGGEYPVPFEWSMGGGWIVTVTAQLPDNAGSVSDTFEFFVEAVSSESVINRPGGVDAESVNIAYQPDDEPTTGVEGTVTITLTTPNGSAITDAVVEVVATMNHAGMAPVSGSGEHTENGQYVAPLLWTMAGDWVVTVRVTLADGRELEQAFDQQVALP